MYPGCAPSNVVFKILTSTNYQDFVGLKVPDLGLFTTCSSGSGQEMKLKENLFPLYQQNAELLPFLIHGNINP